MRRRKDSNLTGATVGTLTDCFGSGAFGLKDPEPQVELHVEIWAWKLKAGVLRWVLQGSSYSLIQVNANPLGQPPCDKLRPL